MFSIMEKQKNMNSTGVHYDAVVIGLGQTGLSCVRYLSNQGLKVAVTDSRVTPPGLSILKNDYGSVPVYLGEINSELLLTAEQIILSPGVALNEKAIKQAIREGISVYGDIELFCQQVQAPIIAITGSNGKSTVTTLVAGILQQAGLKIQVGGNLGTPALDLLNEDVPDLYVLELSSFQLETTFSLNAHAAVVLNISPDHMDRYSSLEDYANAKKKIYAGNGLLVINKDDPIVNAMLDGERDHYYFSLSEPDENNFGIRTIDGDVWLCRGEENIIKQDDLPVKGKHNVANALAAMALASSVEVSEAAIVDALKSYSGLAHRCQWVAKINDIDWYNDSKATNVGACISSIESLCQQGAIILIAGGDSKGTDLSSLGTVIQQHVKHVLLLGVDANKIAAVIGGTTPVTFVNNMEEAVEQANRLAVAGNQVLLAPACASLDMYENYQQRGDAFVSAVNALGVD